MIQYQKILQMYFNGNSQRTIVAATGHSWRTVKDVIHRAENKNIIELKPEMDNLWLFGFLYPERQTFERGYYPVNWEYIHKELMKKNVTLSATSPGIQRKSSKFKEISIFLHQLYKGLSAICRQI
ncbi:helix-turn-helix domain containing protein [Paenibacillus sp. EZ-K15]|uniref:helix-turn-helix domain containing protein n=1 Tax=Paenibacillus sp. EZ-K15 TaxID=2044275 RepID=UPI001F433800|nr:helix-turn-helix domain containing protein [Paenibacillus sp. EZ-K15]